MKIRLDFVTNSSSSSFVVYKLTNSEFCKYLSKQMEKHDLETATGYNNRPASDVYIEEDRLDANISCSERLNCNKYAPEISNGNSKYSEKEKEEDIKKMVKLFLDILGEFIDFSKIDDPAKLYDAFLDDLEHNRFECDVYMGQTD